MKTISDFSKEVKTISENQLRKEGFLYEIEIRHDSVADLESHVSYHANDVRYHTRVINGISVDYIELVGVSVCDGDYIYMPYYHADEILPLLRNALQSDEKTNFLRHITWRKLICYSPEQLVINE